jgi:uncharacterized membrane protein YvbJ
MPSIKHCPACGADIPQPTPYCRKCGSDIRAVQMALDKPDITTDQRTTRKSLTELSDQPSSSVTEVTTRELQIEPRAERQ